MHDQFQSQQKTGQHARASLRASRAMRPLFAFALASVAALPAEAKIEVAPVFTDNMVLQREMPLRFFGRGAGGEHIIIELGGEHAETVVEANGEWHLELKPRAANDSPQSIKISNASDSSDPGLTVRNVRVGDVWVIAGSALALTAQSGVPQTEAALNREASLAVHVFSPAKTSGPSGAQASSPVLPSWSGASWTANAGTPDNELSAAALEFALRIAKSQQGRVPIGIIMLPSASPAGLDPWIAPEGLIDFPAIHKLHVGGPAGSRPSSMLDALVLPIAPFGIKGVLFDPSEPATEKNEADETYEMRQAALVDGWRAVWRAPELPFYVIQAGKTGPPSTSPAPDLNSSLVLRRAAQTHLLPIPHTGLVPTFDMNVDDRQVPDAREVAGRLASLALRNEYGQAGLVAGAPMLDDIDINNQAVACYFSNPGRGFCVMAKDARGALRQTESMSPHGFSICGPDGVWHAAKSFIDDDLLLIWSDAVREPVGIAYGFVNNPANCDLYNVDGLPALPFFIADVRKRFMLTTSLDMEHLAPADIANIEDIGVMTPPPARRPALAGSVTGFTFAPPLGFYVENVMLEGEPLGGINRLLLGPLDKAHTLVARITIARPLRRIVAAKAEHGQLLPAGSNQVPQGGTPRYLVIPDKGFRVGTLTVDGVDLGARSSFTFTGVGRDHTIEATFVPAEQN